MTSSQQTRSWKAFLLYNLLLWLAGLLLVPFVLYRLIHSRDFRRSLPARFGLVQELEPSNGRVLLHGVSVGEVKALKPLVLEFQQRYPQRELVIASSTPTGLALARQLYQDLPVVAYPLDLPGAGRRFLARVKPSIVVLAELEIWPNFLRSCDRLDIEVAIVNGRITERSMAGYRRVQRWLPQFDGIALYGVQNQRYAERFQKLSVPDDRIVVTGNLKYDNLPTPSDDIDFEESVWSRWCQHSEMAAWASTHEPEEQQLLRAWLANPASTSFVAIVVPRHPRRSNALMQMLQREVGPRPLLKLSENRDLERLPPGAVILVDSFGELEAIYRAVRCAFLGGSLIGHGGQNMLEAAAVGVPVVVGPHTENFFEEVEKLKAEGGLKVVEDPLAVVEWLVHWLQNPEVASDSGRKAAKTLESERGAAQSTLLALQKSGLLAN
ncbi:MAG: glycosyltransferase N-terminal domain-containing protein [Planctomycetota bacterium]|jgi:3-deoxy-D-manno-octulosonic-acid transferase|nr:glycosyltransferase N-terminal domain-containing protein [Planctomycetota bacterium]